jgi:hypothetical protein
MRICDASRERDEKTSGPRLDREAAELAYLTTSQLSRKLYRKNLLR